MHVKRAVNTTKNVMIAKHVRVADNFLSRLKGLMGVPGLPEGHGLWIVPCADIHSCFMRFEFDAIFMDHGGKVVHLVERMKPWRMTPWIKGSKVVLELDGGVIDKTGTELGDIVVLE